MGNIHDRDLVRTPVFLGCCRFVDGKMKITGLAVVTLLSPHNPGFLDELNLVALFTFDHSHGLRIDKRRECTEYHQNFFGKSSVRQ